MSVTVSPTIITILDIHPYNLFSISCDVWSPKEVVSPKRILWRTTQRGSDQLSTVIGSNIPNMTVVDEDIPVMVKDGGHVLRSTVSGNLRMSGEYHFCCDGFIEIPEDVGPSVKSEAIVIVKGQNYTHIYAA